MKNTGKRIGKSGKKNRKKATKRNTGEEQFGVLAMRRPFQNRQQVICLFVFSSEADAVEFAAHELGTLTYMQRIIGKGKPRMRSCFVDISWDSIHHEQDRYMYINDAINESVTIVCDASGTGMLTRLDN